VLSAAVEGLRIIMPCEMHNGEGPGQSDDKPPVFARVSPSARSLTGMRASHARRTRNPRKDSLFVIGMHLSLGGGLLMTWGEQIYIVELIFSYVSTM
jgi:hypothetical protein